MKYLLTLLFFVIAYPFCVAQNREELSLTDKSYDSTQVSKEYLLGKEPYKESSLFTVIDPKYTPLSKNNAYIRIETYEAFKKMYYAALEDGITLRVTSATRRYVIQRIIWEDKWVKSSIPEGIERMRSILEYSSVPGISRHHWGTDIDLMSPKLSFWESEKGTKIYKWLTENAYRYGFYQPYTANPIRTGFSEEKWHWSYYPLSDSFTEQYRKKIKPSDLKGFVGDKYLSHIDVIEEYVFGIDR